MKKRSIQEEELKFLETDCNLDYKRFIGISKLEFEEGEIFITTGEPIEYLYFVLSGKAKVIIATENGRHLLPCYYVSKGLIGDIEFMTGQTEAFSTMQAVTNFVCIAIPKKENEALLKDNLFFVNFVAKGLSYKLMQSNMYSAINLLHSLEERLCAYIAQASYQGIFCEKLTDVALWLGTSYRHLLRSLDKLCQEGILEKQKGGYRILDEKELLKKATEKYM